MSCRLCSNTRAIMSRVPAADPVEVDLGDLVSGDVPGAAQAQQRHLERLQAAGLESLLPQPPRRVEEVQVRHLPEGEAAAVQAEAGVEERDVEGLPVVGDDAREAGEVFFEGLQQRPLLVIVAHEVLPHLEAVALEPARADQEGGGAGAAGETRGLGVQEDRFPQVEAGRGRAPRPGCSRCRVRWCGSATAARRRAAPRGGPRCRSRRTRPARSPGASRPPAPRGAPPGRRGRRSRWASPRPGPRGGS